jgi:fatty-acyl-CoA synthase
MRCATFARVSLEAASNLGEILRVLATAYGERPAVIGERDALSFAALDGAADRWATALRRGGYGPGTHVALLAGNGPAWLAAAFGVWRAGATLVPISTFVTARELGEILAHADANLLLVQPRLRSHDYLEALTRLPPLPALREIVVLGDDAPGAYRSAAAFVADHAESTAAAVPADGVACILYTSGTTGQPKGVMLSHRAILATVLPTAKRTGLTETDSLLSTLPLFWVAGLVIRALPTLASGSALILVETFTVDALVAVLRRHRPSALHLRPPQVAQVLHHPHFEPALLANVRRGGGRVEWYAPHLDPQTTSFITGYGMTETAGYVTALDWRDPPEVRRSQLGTPLPGVEVRIAEGNEIRVRGPGLFSGYYKQAAGTGLGRDGFFATGDIGDVDARGGFYFTGRSKDLLRVKGINVSPMEVEAVLASHPAVEAAYVIGVPPDGLEQQLVACVVTKPGKHVVDAELRAVAAEALSHYKRPEHYVFITRGDVALSGTSKPQRAALAGLAAERLRSQSSVAAGFKPASSSGVAPSTTPQHGPTARWRKSIRLQGYDYAQAGMYFCTIVTSRREPLLGDVVDGAMQPNDYALAVEQCWADLPHHYPHLQLDAFVVMPNHVHAIVALTAAAGVAAGFKPAATKTKKTHGLSEVIRAFKTFSAQRINESRRTPGAGVWQHGYYEHIIRDEAGLNRIRDYISTNPQRWALDRENPRREGDDEFDAWLARFARPAKQRV